MKPIYDKGGQLTDSGTDLVQEFEQISIRFIKKHKPTPKEMIELEFAMQRAVNFKATMYRLSIQGLIGKVKV